MKKTILLAALFVAALTFGTLSCKKESKTEPKDDGVAKCWAITVTITFEGQSETETRYFWGTQAQITEEMAIAKDGVEELGGTLDYVANTASKYTTQEACEANNPKE